jgi:hypothetical protein
MQVRFKAFWIWSAFLAVILALGIAWALLRMGILFSIEVAPPDFTEPSARAWSLAKFSLGVGALTMALIQVVRVLVPIRGYFHREQLLEWLSGFGQLTARSTTVSPDNRSLAQQALLDFETRGGIGRSDSLYKRNLYDGSIEQLCAQLNVALETGIDSPRQIPTLLLCFFGADGIEQLEILHGHPFWKKPDLKSTEVREATEPEDWKESKDESEILRKAEARATLTRLVQFRIDAFQIAAAGRWRRSLRSMVTLTSLMLSFAVTTSSIWHSTEELNRKGQIASICFYATLEGLIAAFVAMLLRDLVAIVEARRRSV